MRVIWAFCFVFCMIALQSVVFGDYYDDYEGVPSDPYGGGAGNDPSGPPEARELKTNEDIDSFLKVKKYNNKHLYSFFIIDILFFFLLVLGK